MMPEHKNSAQYNHFMLPYALQTAKRNGIEKKMIRNQNRYDKWRPLANVFLFVFNIISTVHIIVLPLDKVKHTFALD